MARWRVGDCVALPDGRIGRVRAVAGRKYRVRVRRKSSATHQFLMFQSHDLKRAKCPRGWMSREGYVRYLKTTLTKMRQREAAAKKTS